MSKTVERDLAAEWLEHHRCGFERAAAQLSSRQPVVQSWFKRHQDACGEANENLRKNGLAVFQTKTPLFIDGVRPRSWQSSSSRPALRAYLALEATLVPRAVQKSSLKFGLVDDRSNVLFRLMYDYDVTTSASGFPFHTQWGKNPGELKGSYKPAYDDSVDEPRIPAVPLDFFILLQIVHEQFQRPKVTEDLQSKEWKGTVAQSTVFVCQRWCVAAIAALKKQNDFLAAARDITWPTLGSVG